MYMFLMGSWILVIFCVFDNVFYWSWWSSNMSVLELFMKESNVLKGYEGGVLVVSFNSDGNYCFSCGKDCIICFWNFYCGIYIKIYKLYGCEVCDVYVIL